ncbi:Uncharacterised protein [Serratia fonticola]|uniref:Uncharacterized protein n=1 Tax=Serratia fonticola TaxID=47917 RepID=A0A4U9VYT9_SERFO|nr:Uncharacterised protein [Serratia fonticola]
MAAASADVPLRRIGLPGGTGEEKLIETGRARLQGEGAGSGLQGENVCNNIILFLVSIAGEHEIEGLRLLSCRGAIRCLADSVPVSAMPVNIRGTVILPPPCTINNNPNYSGGLWR